MNTFVIEPAISGMGKDENLKIALRRQFRWWWWWWWWRRKRACPCWTNPISKYFPWIWLSHLEEGKGELICCPCIDVCPDGKLDKKLTEFTIDDSLTGLRKDATSKERNTGISWSKGWRAVVPAVAAQGQQQLNSNSMSGACWWRMRKEMK